MGANPVQIKTIAFGVGIAAASLAGALLISIAPVIPSTDRDYIGRMFAITVLGGMGSIGGTLVAAVILGVAESLMSTFFGPSWSLAVSFGLLLLALAVRPRRALRALDAAHRRGAPGGAGGGRGRDRASPRLRVNPYFYFAGYVILQYVVIATAWNILGGYAGYVNFGTLGVLRPRARTPRSSSSSRCGAPLPVLPPAGGLVSALPRPRHRLSHAAPARRRSSRSPPWRCPSCSRR